VVQPDGIDVARDAAVCEQRLQLGGEPEAPGARVVVERLLADPVACQQETPPRRVPQREREHAAQVLDTALAAVFRRRRRR
jgi:hypothetical protein